MAACIALLAIAAAACFQKADAFTAGAPISACATLTQQHPGVFNTMQCVDCPYNVTLVAIDGEVTNGTQYRCGSQHTRESIPSQHIILLTIIL